MLRILALLLLLACAPCLADPTNANIQSEVRWTWGTSIFESSPQVTTAVGKPATISLDDRGIKLDVTYIVKEILDTGFVTVVVKLRMTPQGQAATTAEIGGIGRLGQPFTVDLKPDETRNVSVEFTITKQAPPAP